MFCCIYRHVSLEICHPRGSEGLMTHAVKAVRQDEARVFDLRASGRVAHSSKRLLEAYIELHQLVEGSSRAFQGPDFT